MGDQLKVYSVEHSDKLTNAIIYQMAHLVRIGLFHEEDSFVCVRVRALKTTRTIHEGNEYWGVKQIQYRGWHCNDELDVITLVGGNRWNGPRDYSPKSFEILESYEVPFETAGRVIRTHKLGKPEECL